MRLPQIPCLAGGNEKRKTSPFLTKKLHISKQKGFQVTSCCSTTSPHSYTSNHWLDKVLWVEVFDAGIAFRQVLTTIGAPAPSKGKSEFPLEYSTCKLYLGCTKIWMVTIEYPVFMVLVHRLWGCPKVVGIAKVLDESVGHSVHQRIVEDTAHLAGIEPTLWKSKTLIRRGLQVKFHTHVQWLNRLSFPEPPP